MKTKFSISVWTWLIIAFAVFAGYAREVAIGLAVLLGHELAHFVLHLYYGRSVAAVEIYPFGGIIKVNNPMVVFSPEEILIAFAGPAMNFFCTALGWLLLLKTTYLSEEIKLWWQINLWMGIINLLPLFPLDGGRICAAVMCRFFGYRKTIYAVSYFTQGVIVCGLLYLLIIRRNIADLQYLLVAVVIFFAAAKERNAAPFVMLRYLLKKTSSFNLRKYLPARMIAAREDCCLGDLVTEMKEDYFYLICAIDENQHKRLLSEKSIIENLIEKGARTKLKEIKEKDFVV